MNSNNAQAQGSEEEAGRSAPGDAEPSAPNEGAGGGEASEANNNANEAREYTITVPTKTEDGGAATSSASRANDAFARYSDNEVRMNALLGLSRGAAANGDVRDGADGALARRGGRQENPGGHANEAQENPPGERRTRLSWEVHIDKLLHRWSGR